MLWVPSGSMTLKAVDNTPTYAQIIEPTQASKCVYASHQPPWQICRQTVVLTLFRVSQTLTAALSLKSDQDRRSAQASFLTAALPDSSSVSFWPFSMRVSTIFLLCQKCFISPSAWLFVFGSMFCLTSEKPHSAVLSFFSCDPPRQQNAFCQQLIKSVVLKNIYRGSLADVLVRSCCLKSGFSGEQGEMLVNMTESNMQCEVKPRRNDKV